MRLRLDDKPRGENRAAAVGIRQPGSGGVDARRVDHRILDGKRIARPVGAVRHLRAGIDRCVLDQREQFGLFAVDASEHDQDALLGLVPVPMPVGGNTLLRPVFALLRAERGKYAKQR